MMNEKIKVIRSAVGSMTSWGLIEELQKAGVEVIGMDSNPISFGLHLLKKSYIVPRGDDPNFIKGILKIVDKTQPDAILSGPEEELLTLSKNKEIIEERGTLLLCPDYEYVEICTDKRKTNEVFNRIGIPTPELFTDADSVKFPCMIKPRFGRGSSDIYIAKNEENLRFYLKKIEEPVIQEFVQGEEYTVDILADKDGNALSIVPRSRLGTESGISVKGKTVYDKEIIDYCKKIAKELKLFGPSCIQCIRSKEGVKFIEVNTRFGGGSILSIKADPTIISNLIKMIKGEKPEPSKGFKEGFVMLRYYSEVFIEGGDQKDKRSFMKAIIFDLDNTLYDAEQYYIGAFKRTANYLSGKYNLSKQEIYKRLVNLWKEKTSMYSRLFNDLLDFFNLGNELENVIKIFNNYDGEIKPYPDVIPTVKELKKRNCKLGIITDGNVERQKRKIKSLGLDRFFDAIVFTKELDNPKPSEIPFREAMDKLKAIPQNSLYVGDNPLIDFEGAKKVGMKTIRVLKGGFRDIPENRYIDYEINELKELLNMREKYEIG